MHCQNMPCQANSCGYVVEALLLNVYWSRCKALQNMLKMCQNDFECLAHRRKTQAARLRNMGSFSRQRSSRIQMAMDRAASQSGLDQHKRLSQQKARAQTDAATANGHMPAARKSFGTGRPGLHGVMSGLQPVTEEDAARAESPLAPTQNGAAATREGAQPAPVAAVSGGATGGAQFIVGGAKQAAPPAQEQQLPPRTKPVKVPSRGRNYPYGMSQSSSPLPVLLSPFAAAAATSSTAPAF